MGAKVILRSENGVISLLGFAAVAPVGLAVEVLLAARLSAAPLVE